MYIADIREYLKNPADEVIEVTFYNRPKVNYSMMIFGMLLTDPGVKEIMSLRTGEILYIKED